MSRRRNPPKHESSQESGKAVSRHLRWPWLLGGVIVAVVVAFIALQPPPVDQRTFCPLSDKDNGATVLLIDISDKLTPSQMARLESELEHLSAESAGRDSYLAKRERLTVYFMQEDGFPPEKVFDLCNPGDPDNRGFLESLSEGEIYARKRWQEFESNVLQKVNEEIRLAQDQQTSPILETLKFVREKEFPPPDLLSSRSNHRILLWSDMIQNSSIENHYSGLGDVRGVNKVNPVNLEGVDLTVFHITSRKYSRYQTNEQVAWWRKIISLTHANLDWKVL